MRQNDPKVTLYLATAGFAVLMALGSVAVSMAADVSSAAGVLRASAQEAAGRHSVWDGVSTTEQARRGQLEYDASCGNCHLFELQGDEAADVPPLTGIDFMREWNNRSVNELFQFVSKSMPVGRPGSLTNQVYVDILAYVLSANGFPQGDGELTPEPEWLERILIEAEQPRPAK